MAIKKMEINRRLSSKGCWRMVNAIQNGETPREIRERAEVAEDWLYANEVIDEDELGELLRAVAYLVRESYHMA